MNTVDPSTQQQVQAVFVPKLKPGYWSGSVQSSLSLSDSKVVDDDVDALRKGQL